MWLVCFQTMNKVKNIYKKCTKNKEFKERLVAVDFKNIFLYPWNSKEFPLSKDKMEKYIQMDTNRNCNRYFSNRSLDTLISLAYLFENRQYNQNRPKRVIRSFRSLSKQAKKEWIMKHKYSSTFDWFEEDEWEM